jgi:hypothetical protein
MLFLTAAKFASAEVPPLQTLNGMVDKQMFPNP